MALDSIIGLGKDSKKNGRIIDLTRGPKTPIIWTSPDEVEHITELVRSTHAEEVTSRDLRRVFHLTSHENWQEMKKNSFITPRSSPFLHSTPDDHPEYVHNIATQDHYIVGIPPQSFGNWADYGYMRDLLDHTRRDSDTRGVLLSFTLEDTSGVFFRESKYNSPKFLMENYGINNYTRLQFVQVLRQSPELLESYNRYVKSTTSFEDYKGDFEVPEIWIPQKIPLSGIKILLLD